MRIVEQNLVQEIEYLSALARMLERNSPAHKATIAAIAALQQLLQVIDQQPDEASASIPIAA